MSRLVLSHRLYQYGPLQPPPLNKDLTQSSSRSTSASSPPPLDSCLILSPPPVSLSAYGALQAVHHPTPVVIGKERLPPEQTISLQPETPADGNALSVYPGPSLTSQSDPPPQMAPPTPQSNSSSPASPMATPGKENPNLFDGGASELELIGITLAGLAIISFVAFVFALIRKNKNKHAEIFVCRHPPRNFSEKLDDHYRRAPSIGNYSPYSSPRFLKDPSLYGSSYLGYGGNGLHSGRADSGAIRNSKFHSGLVDSGAMGIPRFHSGLADSAAKGNSRIHSSLADSGAIGSSRIHSSLADTGAIGNSSIHSGLADSAAIGNSRIHSGPRESGAIGNSRFHSGPADSGLIGNSKLWFTYDELMDITCGFSKQNFLGEGGFGYVYKGQLPDGKQVAVKQLKVGGGQGEREFKAEVDIIGRVHHRHLVSLVGYCIAEHHRLLVYEFVPNNTLEHHLHGKGMPVLEWSKRAKIAIGAAKGLAYLHEDCHPRIIHRDIKSANILLDESFEAQVADFGLAKPSADALTHVSTRVMGTFGYLAPEYASSGKLTDRSDVFSFGVVLLELVTGRKPVDSSQPFGEESLVDWARPLLIQVLESGDLRELLDPRLGNRYVESEVINMIEIAAVCICHSAPKRPRMVQVVRALDSEGSISDLSKRAKFGSSIYSAGQCMTDIQRVGQMGSFSSHYSSANGSSTGREHEQKMSAYSGQSPHGALNPKRASYGYEYGASGEFQYRETPPREYQSRERPHRPPNTWKGSDHGSDHDIDHARSGEYSIRKMLPRPQKSRKGSDCSSGHGPSGEYEGKSSGYAGEYQSREVHRKPSSPMMDNEPALNEIPSGLDLEAWRGSDRNSSGAHANVMNSPYNRR